MELTTTDFMRQISQQVVLVAELSANHGGSLETAIETIRAAKRAGADAIKLQTYTADTITINCQNDYFKIGGGTLWDGRTLYNLYEEAHTPWAWHAELFRVAKEEGLICFSSPFDPSAVDFLEQFEPPAYKIASFEIQDIPLIQYVAAKGRPVIISTGIAIKEDLDLAVDTCRAAGNNQIILLKCTSAYPAPIEEANLRTIPFLHAGYNLPVGLSDHTTGTDLAMLAVAQGACMIEKHFILNKEIGGPDAAFSLDENEFAELVQKVRLAEKALGKATLELSPKALANKKFGRSLFVVEPIRKGEKISLKNVRSIRPAQGLHPKHLNNIIGKQATRDLAPGTPLRWEDLSE